MNHFKLSHLAFLISTLALLAGCTTTQVTEVQPASTGKIEGSVYLYEMDCTPSASSAGVTVNLVGTSISATTDSNGHFVLDGVPAGYYTAHYSKAGFSDYYFWNQYGFVGAGAYPIATAMLTRTNNWTTTLFGAVPQKFIRHGSADSVSFNVLDNAKVQDTSGKQLNPTLCYFVGKHEDVHYSDSNTWFAFNAAADGTGPTMSDKYAQSGDTLYIVAYPVSCYTQCPQTYYSGDTLKTIFTGLGPPSNVVKFVLP